MDTPLDGVKIGEREIRFITAMNRPATDSLDIRPERPALRQLGKSFPQRLGERVHRGVVQSETLPRVCDCRRMIAALERRFCRPCQFEELGVKAAFQSRDHPTAIANARKRLGLY